MRVLRYGVVGGIAALVDFVLFGLFAHLWGYDYLVVGVCTFTLATAVNYVLSVRHVFESGVRYSKRREIALVFLVSLGAVALNQAALYLLVDSLHVHLLAAKCVATSIAFIWNYHLRARLIFCAKDGIEMGAAGRLIQ